MRIAIAEDNEIFAQKTEEVVKNYFAQKQIPIFINIFCDGEYLLLDLGESKNYDIYLLDIEMPKADGFKVAERIRRWDKKAYIVFITSYEQYAAEGYNYQACSYVMKEKCAEQLPKVLDHILEMDHDDQEPYYRIMNEQKYERFRIKDILYMKKEGKNTIFYCRNGAHYQERATLENIYKRFDSEEFMYVNRGEIISLRHVTGLRQGNIELYDISLPISRYLLTEVKRTLARYWGKE